jgi:hypothetical protein
VSEYQYYEFRALDRRLTAEQQRRLRSLSSRAEISATRFTSEYSFGDFQRQGHPALQGKGRVTAGEDQPQAVVVNLISLVEQLAHRFLIRLGLRYLETGLLEQFRAAGGPPQPVDRAVAGDGGQPGSGAPRDAVSRPLSQRLGECVLRALLG